MSKPNNVNPGQYKVAGRLHPGDPATQDIDRAELAKSRKASGPRRRTAAARSGSATRVKSRRG